MTHHAPSRARKVPGAFNATCSCGWTSPNRVTAGKAYCDVDEHVREALVAAGVPREQGMGRG